MKNEIKQGSRIRLRPWSEIEALDVWPDVCVRRDYCDWRPYQRTEGDDVGIALRVARASDYIAGGVGPNAGGDEIVVIVVFDVVVQSTKCAPSGVMLVSTWPLPVAAVEVIDE